MALDIKKFLKGLRILNDADTTKALELNAGGATNTKTTVVSSQTANRTVTLPDATDTLVGKATTDTLTNKTFDADGTGNSITNIENADIKVGAAIDATKIHDGTVDNTEFGYLNGVTSAIQTQLNGKEATSNKGIANGYASLDANGLVPTTQMPPAALERMVVVADQTARFALTTSTVQNGDTVYQTDTSTMYMVKDDTNLSNSSGYQAYSAGTSVNFTGSLAGDITGTQGATTYNGVVPVAKGGTNSSAALTNNKAMISSGGAIIEAATTGTEIGYLSGVTSSVQTQLDAKIAKSIVTTKGDLITATGSSTPVRQAIGSDGQILVADSSQANGLKWATANSGSKNYFQYNSFENNATTGWSLGTATLTTKFPSGAPTFGSGASGNLSLSTVSGSPIAGTYALSYASSTITTEGNFVASDAFIIDAEDQAKVLQFKFSYKAAVNPSNANWSGTTSNSFGVAIYDVTNSVWIQPAGCFNLVQSSGVGIASGTFQTSSNGTSYRLVVYNANATSGAVTVYFDSFFVGPQITAAGAAVSDEVSYTPSLTNVSIGNGSITAYWSRRGERIKIRGTISVGSTTSITGSIIIANPNNFAFKSTYTGSYAVPSARYYDASTSQHYSGSVQKNTNTSITIFTTADSVIASSVWNNSTPVVPATGDEIAFDFEAPIEGWSSNTVMSSDTDTRVISAEIGSGAVTTVNTGTSVKLPFGTVSVDDIGGVDTTNNRYVARVSGKYLFASTVATGAATGSKSFLFYKNGSSTGGSFTTGVQAYQGMTGVKVLNLNAGDYVEVYGSNNSGTNEGWLLTNLSVQRLSGPATIAASEVVAFNLIKSGNQTITGGAGATTITTWTARSNTHSSIDLTTGIFTAPVTGFYDFVATASVTMGATASTDFSAYLYKNDTATMLSFDNNSDLTANKSYVFDASMVGVYLLAGDTVRFKLNSASNNVTANGSLCFFAGKKVGQ